MRIDKIVLNNFGSYEGETVFDTGTENGRNIILVGGKNGAGKTTLFTAMRVCLYGYMSMGYKNYNAFYTRAISKQINNAAKMTKPTSASVAMQITLSNGRDLDIYDLTRSWVLDKS
jgi:DNA sulfur modification protein DndD